MNDEGSGSPPSAPRTERHLADLVGLDRFGAFSDGVYAIAITLVAVAVALYLSMTLLGLLAPLLHLRRRPA
jgi:hypothetical protein